MRKNSIFLFISFITLFHPVYSSDMLHNLIGIERAKELVEKGSVTYNADEKDSLLLVPDYSFVKDLINDFFEELHPDLFVETLHLYQKPSGASHISWTDNEKLLLLNETLALSKLEGIEYYSKSKGKMRILYEKSRVIARPENKKEIADPVCSVVPDSLKVFVKQKDTTFGENIYLYNYYCRSDAFLFVQENLTSMNYGILPLVGKNNLRSVVAVIDAGEYLLVYGLSMTKASAVSWMKKRVKESFSNRANAVMQWFSRQADGAYRKANL